MMQLKNKLVLITGASSGIGLACARVFASMGAKLLLSARRLDLLQNIAQALVHEFQVEVYPLQLDVTQLSQVNQMLNSLPESWQAVDILVNNAGLALGLDTVFEGDLADWDTMIDTNVKGLLYVTRAILPQMVKKNSGHIVNIGSIAGHRVYPKGAVYCASKFAVSAFTEGLRMDLLGSQVRVSMVSPGAVETNFSVVRFKGDEQRAAAVYQGIQPLTAQDIADAIAYCVTRPAHVNVNEIVIMPTQQASATMIHRKLE